MREPLPLTSITVLHKPAIRCKNLTNLAGHLEAVTVEPSEISPDKTSLVLAAQKAIATVAAIREIQRGKV